MTRVRFVNGVFIVEVCGFNASGKGLYAKFDTGATTTVITLDKLYGRLCEEQLNSVKELLEEKCRVRKLLYSATNNTMFGYMVYSSNVSIGNFKLNNFYYYLVPENKKPTFLLGNDFISCCDFSHENRRDILIRDFHYQAYTENVQRESVVSVDEIFMQEQGALGIATVSNIFA